MKESKLKLRVILLLSVFFFLCFSVTGIKYSIALEEIRILKEEISQAKQYEQDCWAIMYEHLLEADKKGWHKHKEETHAEEETDP